MVKKEKRLYRAKRTRLKIKELKMMRLNIHRTPRHIYAQVISPDSRTLVSVSSLEKTVKKELTYGGNIKAANLIGKLIAERALKAGIQSVAFDRSGFKYHGRVKALAEAARGAGLSF